MGRILGSRQFSEQGFNPTGDFQALLAQQTQTRQQEQGVFAGGFGRARRQTQGRFEQGGVHLLGIPTTNTMPAQDAGDSGLRELYGLRRQGSGLKQLPEPGFIGRRGQLQQLREETMPLFAQLVGKAILFLTDVIFESRELAQPDDGGVVQAHGVKTMQVGA
jgi:hypothetical protein